MVNRMEVGATGSARIDQPSLATWLPGRTWLVLAPLDRRNRIIFLSIAGILVCCLTAVAAFTIRMDRTNALLRHSDRIEGIAQLLAYGFEESIETVDTVVGTLLDDMRGGVPGGYADFDEAFGGRITAMVGSLNEISGAFVLDAAGVAVWSTTQSALGMDVSDRPYFTKARLTPHGGRVIGSTLVSRNDGGRFTPIAWPVFSREGTLQAVFVASFDSAHFARLFEIAQVPDGTEIEILDKLGDIIFSSTTVAGPPLDDIGDGGSEAAGSEMAGSEAARGDMMSIERLIPEYEMRIVASARRGDVLAIHNVRSRILIGLSLVFFLVLSGIVYLLLANARRLASSLDLVNEQRMAALSSKAEFETIFNNVSEGIVVFDADRENLRYNWQSVDLLRLSDRASPADRLVAEWPELDTVPEGKVAQRILTTADERRIRCRATRILRGRTHRTFCVLSDVTENERLMESRAALITSINHELRTPLTSLLGSLRLMEVLHKSGQNKQMQDLMEIAHRNGDRLAALVDDVLTLQSMENGALRVVPVRRQVADLIDRAVEENGQLASDQGVALTVADMAEPAAIDVDPLRFQQIMSNLISNAVKYSGQDRTVWISSTEADGRVRIAVRDTGPGIAKVHQGKVFGRFCENIAEGTTRTKGTGLGLAIAKELVELQGGSVDFVSSTGEFHGSTFFVNFPLSKSMTGDARSDGTASSEMTAFDRGRRPRETPGTGTLRRSA